jgi:hypothetical protein
MIGIISRICTEVLEFIKYCFGCWMYYNNLHQRALNVIEGSIFGALTIIQEASEEEEEGSDIGLDLDKV